MRRERVVRVGVGPRRARSWRREIVVVEAAEHVVDTLVGARAVGPPQGLDIRSTLQRISTELQSISYAATTSMLTALPLNRPELMDLTSREVEVLSILLAGDRVPTIAERLHISQNTVRNHLKSMYRKLEVGSQTELINLMRSYADDAEAMPEAADA